MLYEDKGADVAYFLKKTRNKKGTYLQIYESHWDSERRQTVQTSVRPVGYAEELAESEGLDDPIEHYRKVVKGMNEERAKRIAEEKAKARPEPERTGDVTPLFHLGHFPLMAVHRALEVERDLALLQLKSGLRFPVHDLLSSLAYARAVSPCPEGGTFHDALPQMLGVRTDFSPDQLYDGLAFLGNEYEKVIECYNAHVKEVFGRDTSSTFFDCMDFYFVTDGEDGADPIVGVGLMLDADCIPIGMKMFPGNESEKPKLKGIAEGLRRRYSVTGRTIVVADMGLDCAGNIASALPAGDGYIFSESVKYLARQERDWALADDGTWEDVRGRNGELLYRYKETVGEFTYEVTDTDGKAKTVLLREKRVVTHSPDHEAGYNMFVTSEEKMPATRIYDTYHRLEGIEETFRAMKAELEARPVYLQRQNTIGGHFLVCYIAVLLLRLLQFKVLGDEFGSEEIMEFVRGFDVVKQQVRGYVNVSRQSEFIDTVEERSGFPMRNLYLGKAEVDAMAKCKLSQIACESWQNTMPKAV